MRTRPLAAALALLTLAACDSSELTQVVVVVDSDSKDFERVKIGFEGLSQVDAIEIDPRMQKLPRRVTLVHDGGPLGPFGVTVSAFGSDHNAPVLVEPRRQLFFERGQARMLKIDLLQECIGQCNAGQACLGAAVCESSSSDAATRLVNWSGEVGPLDMHNEVPPDEMPAAGAGGTAGDGTPQMPEMPVMPVSAFPFTPTNFDAKGPTIPGDRVAVVLDCGGEPTFDSSEGRFSAWCGAEPFATTVEQRDGSEAMLLVMDTLSIAGGTTLRLVGSRPVIIAVYGDAAVLGAIDASAAGATPGAGGNVDCGASAGTRGTDISDLVGASGGGGGGFGSAGGKGGGSDSALSVAGGATLGDATLSPLRGGCPGGNGGLGEGISAAPGGAGGGAVQLSAAGQLTVTGWIAANGAGGKAGATLRDAGGGGGSGGAILLEGNALVFDEAAVVVANGGGGGGGNPTALEERASDGDNGGLSVLPASGGDGPHSGGRGGDGAARATSADDGEDAEQSMLSDAYGSGGGGGGGAGRIRVAQDACIAQGTFSPALGNECTGGAPPSGGDPPTSECTMVESAGRSWVHCTDRLSWSDAQASCVSKGMSLAEVDDEAEQDVLVDLAEEYSWLGARDASVEGEWTWERSGVTFWSQELDDAVGDAFVDWASTQPDSDPGDQDCLAESTYGWIDQDCSERHEYFCERAE